MTEHIKNYVVTKQMISNKYKSKEQNVYYNLNN